MVYGINFLIQPRSMMSKNIVTFISRMQKSMQLKLSVANVRLQGDAVVTSTTLLVKFVVLAFIRNV